MRRGCGVRVIRVLPQLVLNALLVLVLQGVHLFRGDCGPGVVFRLAVPTGVENAERVLPALATPIVLASPQAYAANLTHQVLPRTALEAKLHAEFVQAQRLGH